MGFLLLNLWVENGKIIFLYLLFFFASWCLPATLWRQVRAAEVQLGWRAKKHITSTQKHRVQNWIQRISSVKKNLTKKTDLTNTILIMMEALATFSIPQNHSGVSQRWRIPPNGSLLWPRTPTEKGRHNVMCLNRWCAIALWSGRAVQFDS